MKAFRILSEVCHANLLSFPSISNFLLTGFVAVEALPGQPFEMSETGWGEFEITLKFHYVPESGEKPQTLYHNLRLHPYENERGPEVKAWTYEEQIFNEPHEQFYEILTNGPPAAKGGKGKKRMGILPEGVGERTAKVPVNGRPGQPYSKETEKLEVEKLQAAQLKVDKWVDEMKLEAQKKEELLQSLRSGGTTTAS